LLIKAVDEKGIWYDIEMQIAEQSFYGRRALYYWSKIYSEQIEAAEDYNKLNKAIVISLLDFEYFKDQEITHGLALADRKSGKIYPQWDYLELWFVEMCKLKKDFPEITTSLERWVTFLRRGWGLGKGKIPAAFSDDPAMVKAVTELDNFYMSEKERAIRN
jgi:predicted transposase/invertase (TIGR01784 family)